MNQHSPTPLIDLGFPHDWQAEVLPERPLILPLRHFIYPREAEEVERGALEILIRPAAVIESSSSMGAPGLVSETWETATARQSKKPSVQEFLATCALGFRDPAVPTGLWSTPEPEKICAVSGGYAYLIDTTAPKRFTMIPYRPVLQVRPLPAQGLLLFVGHHAIFAWGASGQAWESGKLSDEGLTITQVESGVLRGLGWNMMADKETTFLIDLRTGSRIPALP